MCHLCDRWNNGRYFYANHWEIVEPRSHFRVNLPHANNKVVKREGNSWFHENVYQEKYKKNIKYLRTLEL